MIMVNKDFTDIPAILKKDNRKEAFEQNIILSKYVDEKHRYKAAHKELKKIYHLKCAYCEQKLLDAPKHVEHYRPKDTYYWLAYSWDNLLLSCGGCNSAKGTQFPVRNSRVSYNKEVFADIHNLGNSYDNLEEPILINPEKEDVLDELVFNKNGEIDSSDTRVKSTIDDICKLNRDELVQKRVELLNDFINRINKHYFLFLKEKGGFSRFEPDLELFREKCNKTEQFYSFRYFILNHIELFFEDVKIQKILKHLINKLQ